MRIGEIAALVGVTPRAVRHYHQSGLLPEPARRANGYREYGVRDAVLLARVRRLTELGLGLDEVRVVLAVGEGRGGVVGVVVVGVALVVGGVWVGWGVGGVVETDTLLA
ncbi:MerR family transcriptional regulator, partial [Streptomyces sp. NPDC059556]|uniref:MerR family transcriptional regulator n=1 Tax=Streptomyces sp. NPDC059556 TaxID=3346863 RepID=UPI0036C8EA22